ncbi:PE family protein [Mycobacterium uberis]|uniref:PE family protein n=1 Tax=Mycobacterium uberis TaxID=2162698 RepID=A0A3E1HK23_9MYCO|nr:PE domain-containing protein [Mycobacterium uberis]RFD26808.1 PE family protein [Mycobacterium uberis]
MSFLGQHNHVALTTEADVLQSLGAATVASSAVAVSATNETAPLDANEMTRQHCWPKFFSNHGQQYPAHATRGAAIHQKLVQMLLTDSLASAPTEIGN